MHNLAGWAQLPTPQQEFKSAFLADFLLEYAYGKKKDINRRQAHRQNASGPLCG